MSLTLTPSAHTFESTKSLEQAIFETLAYSDIFDYPLTLDELHKYLVMSTTKEEIANSIPHIKNIGFKGGYYFLIGREAIIETRKSREKRSKKIYRRALFYGKILGRLPFVRMVGLTGSLAMLNLSQEVDMDYMLITQPKRLWIARAFAVTFGRFMRLAGDRICVNLLLSENALFWKEHDVYSAREICQMIPISGYDSYYAFRVANSWTRETLPNILLNVINSNQVSWMQKILEFPFLGKLGDRVEHWAMNFQMKIISRYESVGNETNFTIDICQGNFHQHKKWTQIEYEKRLRNVVASDSEATSLFNKEIASG